MAMHNHTRIRIKVEDTLQRAIETIDATCQLTLPDLRSTFKLSVENIVSPPTAEA